MDAATDTTVYERTLAIDASPETVWEFLVDPEKLMRWKGINADLDPQPGGVERDALADQGVRRLGVRRLPRHRDDPRRDGALGIYEPGREFG